MATAEAIARRRANRAAARVCKERKSIARPDERATRLTTRKRRLLELVTAPLFETGTIDLRYMGVFFLELFSLGWVPLRLLSDASQPSGVKYWGMWMSDTEWDGVFRWWSALPYQTRGMVMMQVCE